MYGKIRIESSSRNQIKARIYDRNGGNGYEESGFELEGYTGPDKFYITNSSHMQRINRNAYAYSMYKQMVQEGKLFECYGCGSKKFVWRKS